MAEQTEHGITWTDRTWNPIRGCTRVSSGCTRCYAERVAHRFNKPGLAYEGLTDHNGRWNGVIRVVEDHILDPLRWKKPQRVFVNSMSDLFHENLPDEAIALIFSVMIRAHKHTYQVLTKRAARMKTLLSSEAFWQLVDVELTRTEGDDFEYCPPLDHIWLGVSVENQATAEERIPLLLQTPAAVRWISAEPLLGPIGFRWAKWDSWQSSHPHFEKSPVEEETGRRSSIDHLDGLRMLDWVVVGGESGQGARPMKEAWVRSLRDECVEAGVAFHFKQWGEFYPQCAMEPKGIGAQVINCSDAPIRIGKRAAGRELDGRTWDEYPAVRP